MLSLEVRGIKMNNDYLNRVFKYKTFMSIAGDMLKQGIISKDEYVKIDTIMLKKYGISSCSIYRDTA